MGGIVGKFHLHTVGAVSFHGAQTMTSTEGGFLQVAFVGVLYNQAALRSSLEHLGYRFETDTAAEVILNMYRQYGTSCVSYCNGMFVIALYDGKKDRLCIWRDRYGVKPCFYAVTKDVFVFASTLSELRAILPETVSGQKDGVAWRQYFTLHSPVGPETIYESILELEPAHMLMVTRAGTQDVTSEKTPVQIALQQYYTLPQTGVEAVHTKAEVDAGDTGAGTGGKDRQEQSEQHMLEQVRCVILDALQQRLPAGQDVDILLSGGLDSAYLAALAVEAGTVQVHTHTLQFVGETITSQQLCDARIAEEVSKTLGTEHTTYTVTGKEALESLPEIADAFDQPYSGGVSLFWLLQRLPARARILMTGDGADEAFFGYPYHTQMYRVLHAHYASATEKAKTLQTMTETLPGLDMGLFDMLMSDSMRSRCTALHHADGAAPTGLSGLDSDHTALHCVDTAAKTAGDDTDRLLQAVVEHYYKVLLPGQVFRYVDTFADVFDRQIRCPYMDAGVVAKAFSLPLELKMKDGQTKYVMKKLAAEKLPASVWNRRKETFLPPIASWLQAEWKEYVLDMLSAERLQRTGHFKGDMVQYLLARFYAGEAASGLAEYIWTILMYELWCDVWEHK